MEIPENDVSVFRAPSEPEFDQTADLIVRQKQFQRNRGFLEGFGILIEREVLRKERAEVFSSAAVCFSAVLHVVSLRQKSLDARNGAPFVFADIVFKADVGF